MRTIQHAQIVLPLLLACTAPAVARAQTAYLEQSSVVGEGKTIYVTRLPVATSGGKITYWDGSINLAIGVGGMPAVTTSPSFTMSAKLVTNHFKAGRYYVKVGSCTTQFANVKEGVGSGGSTVWSLLLDTAANCGSNYPNQTVWQTGAPAPDVAARLNAAKVPNNPNYSYGTTEIGSNTDPYSAAFDCSNGLLAAEQIADELHLVSYTGHCGDTSSQTGSVVFSQCTDTACSNAPM